MQTEHLHKSGRKSSFRMIQSSRNMQKLYSNQLKQFQPVWRESFFHNTCNNFSDRDYIGTKGIIGSTVVLCARITGNDKPSTFTCFSKRHNILSIMGSLLFVNMGPFKQWTYPLNTDRIQEWLWFVTVERLYCIIWCIASNWMILIWI